MNTFGLDKNHDTFDFTVMSVEDLSVISGGSGGRSASACQSQIYGASGIGALAGGIIGGALGSVIPIVGTTAGAALGSGVGALIAGGSVAGGSASCVG